VTIARSRRAAARDRAELERPYRVPFNVRFGADELPCRRAGR
jgi:hypothetical protein